MSDSRAKGVVADILTDEGYRAFLNHTKCPAVSVERLAIAQPTGNEGFFKLGGLRLYGKNSGGKTMPGPDGDLPSIDSLISLSRVSWNDFSLMARSSAHGLRPAGVP